MFGKKYGLVLEAELISEENEEKLKTFIEGKFDVQKQTGVYYIKRDDSIVVLNCVIKHDGTVIVIVSFTQHNLAWVVEFIEELTAYLHIKKVELAKELLG
ncbi:hypothetical protein Asulf_01483 [Archaeoglobus sulfaticallidus PM70-1]|uniref:Uncharacterized protein n=1 Tax=Archaeoglobus sulfaticallidus PM70-1 TaxID=387631 RepID=N0BLQ0_9EURY|nr:hypothetical protein [Archaeoglobus sulfaticallidus]AGK61466.1 hypothetical protein Asulf_01483 [Archaeoglobus sulfaticallidus PM70-1]